MKLSFFVDLLALHIFGGTPILCFFFQGQQQTGQQQTKGKLLDENAKVQTTPNKLNSLIKEQTQLFVPPVVKDGFLVSKIGEMQLLILKILDGFPQLITPTHRAYTTLKIF